MKYSSRSLLISNCSVKLYKWMPITWRFSVPWHASLFCWIDSDRSSVSLWQKHRTRIL